MQTDKLLRAFIEASGFEIEEVDTPAKEIQTNGELVLSPAYGSRSINCKVTKKGVDGYIEDIEDVIRILSNHDTMYKDSLERVIDFLKGL